MSVDNCLRWFVILSFIPSTFPMLFLQSSFKFLFWRCSFSNNLSVFYPPPIVLFSSHQFGNHFLSLTCPLLLYYPHSPHHHHRCPSPFALSSSFPGCGVMYGLCQDWNQWDAGCFNLAWEPSRSRSSMSWKSNSGGLSLLFFSPLPLSSFACCIDQHFAPIGQCSGEACIT